MHQTTWSWASSVVREKGSGGAETWDEGCSPELTAVLEKEKIQAAGTLTVAHKPAWGISM